jgi:hypothetical protein
LLVGVPRDDPPPAKEYAGYDPLLQHGVHRLAPNQPHLIDATTSLEHKHTGLVLEKASERLDVQVQKGSDFGRGVVPFARASTE